MTNRYLVKNCFIAAIISVSFLMLQGWLIGVTANIMPAIGTSSEKYRVVFIYSRIIFVSLTIVLYDLNYFYSCQTLFTD